MPKRNIGKILTRCLAATAIAAVAGFGTLTLSDTSALARGGSGGHGGHAGVAHVGHGAFVGHGVGHGARGGHFVRGGGGRHFWHGRWWGPGIGPCWRWTPLGWIWIC
jgi:hypothetical protein